ncbi:MAG: PDZ domain-containing protein [Planctomycetota bacterium]|jgi:outer membrane lipoprotein-sorting protein
MNTQKDEKWLDDQISSSIDSAKVDFNPEKWKQNYPQEVQILKSQQEQHPRHSRRIETPQIWRIIMKNRITKLAAAAVILVAVLIGINQFGGSLDGASVALADVAKKIEQIKNSVFKKTTIWSSKDNSTNTIDSLVYYAEAGVRADIYDDKKISNQVYVNSSEGIVVGMDHKRKLFKKTNMTDEDIEKFSLMGPKDIVNLMLSKGKYERLGKKEINGILSEGFEINDKRAMLSMDKDIIENVFTRLWVDVNTNLPIRIELDTVLIDDLKANVVMYDPKWDVELESDFFEPKIPDGYITLEQRGFIGINLDNWPTLKVISGMAAEKAGVKDGDVVLKVNGDRISHIKSPADAEIFLFGKIGDKTTLTVKRAEQILTFEIEREPLPK